MIYMSELCCCHELGIEMINLLDRWMSVYTQATNILLYLPQCHATLSRIILRQQAPSFTDFLSV